ncbi:MAG: 6,7-dimethyl-8-ribityllumazine synthase [Bacteroidia bacterium]
MASSLKNLSDQGSISLPLAGKICIGIVVSEWHASITDKLLDGAVKTLLKNKISQKNIFITHVPGAFELALGAQFLAEYHKKADAFICLGCVIQGDTKHFDFICDASAKAISDLNLKYNKPFVFGVLTTNNLQQAVDRSGGKHGNKGDEAAMAALKMIALKKGLLKK